MSQQSLEVMAAPPPTRTEVDQMVFDGLQAAYDANGAFDAGRQQDFFRDRYLTDLGMSRLEFSMRWEAAGRDMTSIPTAPYEACAAKDYAAFDEHVEKAGEGIGRGTIGGLYFNTTIQPTNEYGYAVGGTSTEPEYWEGVEHAYLANAARDRGDTETFTKHVGEAGRRIGRKSEAGLFFDFIRNGRARVDRADDQDYNAAFDQVAIAQASRRSEYDDYRARTLQELTERVVGMRAEVAVMTAEEEAAYQQLWQQLEQQRARIQREVGRVLCAAAYDEFEQDILLTDEYLAGNGTAPNFLA
jgi:hypothetical protein